MESENKIVEKEQLEKDFDAIVKQHLNGIDLESESESVMKCDWIRINLSSFSVSALNECVEDIRRFSRSFTRMNHPELNKQTVDLMYAIQLETRNRSLQELYPEIWQPLMKASDNIKEVSESLKELRKSTKKLEKSTRRLDNSEINRSHANELAIQSCLLNQIAKNYKDIATIQLKKGEIKKGKDAMVQWDIIFVGNQDDIITIFFVEVKEIPHANDIVYISDIPKTKLDFSDKITKTDEFFTSVLNQDDSKRSNEFKIQNAILRPYLNSPRVYVYASGKMYEDIINRLNSLKHNVNVGIAYAECDHYSHCEYSQIGKTHNCPQKEEF